MSDTDLGTDISTPDALDLDPQLSLVSGFEQLGQHLARAITTPTGGLIDDDAWGIDVRDWLNDVPPSTATAAARVRSQWLADPRVEDCDVIATFEGATLSITGSVETAEGPFALVLAVSAVTVESLRVEAL